MAGLRAFACHRSQDSSYVLQVCALLQRHLAVFVYEEHQKSGQYRDVVDVAMDESDVFVVFVGSTFDGSEWTKGELSTARDWVDARIKQLQIVPVILSPEAATTATARKLISLTSVFAYQDNVQIPPSACAKHIVELLKFDGRPLSWQGDDDLPADPHLFSYEKDIVEHFADTTELGESLYMAAPTAEEPAREAMRRKIANGCPTTWPAVSNVTEDVATIKSYANPLINAAERPGGLVASAALTGTKQISQLTFLEARPRSRLVFPVGGGELRVAIAVMGGIAPGINAVIDGIVQRHWSYHIKHGYPLKILGYENGLHSLIDPRAQNPYHLVPHEANLRSVEADRKLPTSEFANVGGSMLGTSRPRELDPSSQQRIGRLKSILSQMRAVDILYLIGGDGTMRAAHALQSIAAQQPLDGRALPLSVIGIPKTMDNDILWMWQSFGFMSAVEKSREVIQHLHTEVASNPRLCVLQLFGSDSGFVVSHAVLASAAGHCDVALIPEVKFSLLGLAYHVERALLRKGQHIPRGMIVMAETAIPEDVYLYLSDTDLPPILARNEAWAADVLAVRNALMLNPDEREAVLTFDRRRRAGRRIEGQTADALRTAGLKVVMQGLETILRRRGDYNNVRFDELRMLRNEPRHLVRAIPPSTSDIVAGQRLGILAVDNALAGYKDFMISQWLTEYVLVPLKLVVLGRKRIPQKGIFWQSVIAKTGQDEDLVKPWSDDDGSRDATESASERR